MVTKRVVLSVLLILVIHGCCAAGSAAEKRPVIVAFATEGIHGPDTISVYSGSAGLHKVIRATGIFNCVIHGYDVGSDTWLEATPDKRPYGPESLMRIRNGRKTAIRLAQFPQDGSIQELALTAGTLTVSSVENGRLVLRFYSLSGSLRSKRVVAVPGKMIVECLDPISVARNGLVAACLRMKGAARYDLYVFDAKGRVLERVGRGLGPEFDWEGRRLAYGDSFMAYDASTGFTSSSEDDLGNTIIYDLKTKLKRTLEVGSPPEAIRPNIPGLSKESPYYSMSLCYWSPDGRQLVCSYSQGEFAEKLLYSIDITSAKLVWKKLPIEVYDGQWIVLEKMPKLHCKP